MEWICRTVSGTSTIRTRIVSATIDHAHESPTFEWKKSRIDLRTFSSGVRIPKTISAALRITGSQLPHATTGCTAGAARPPSAPRVARRACGSRAPRTPSSSGGTCRYSRAGAARRAAGRAGSARRPRFSGARSCRRLPQHLVHARLEPLVPVRLGGLREAPAYHQDVVVRGRLPLELHAHDLAELALDAVANDGVPHRLRHREAQPWLADLLLTLKPVERQEARRDRPAVSVDGVEVARAGKAIPALQRLTPTDACGPSPGGASGSPGRRVSTCGRGSHASASACARWADRSVS